MPRPRIPAFAVVGRKTCLAILLLLAGGTIGIPFPVAAAPPSKISGELKARVGLKKEAARQPKSAQAGFISRADLRAARSLDSEECALYVQERLSPAEIAHLAGQGIRVNDWVWVPPVPGKHPHGYHLVEVEHASLPLIEADARFVWLESTEFSSEPQNDLARAMIGANIVQAGTNPGLNQAYSGAGVKIAVADSGIDLTHPDFPTPVEAYDMTDGTDTSTWGTNVSTTVDDHGTHVAGSAVGSGSLSGGKYAGGGPGASFYFYKVGNDIDASASDTDEIEAIQRAVAVGCDVFSLSYGGYDTYMDGSDAVSQAVDAAVLNDDMVCFVSASNSADDGRHFSQSVAPSTAGATITMTVDNTGNASAYTGTINIRVIWRDAVPTDANVDLNILTSLGGSESYGEAFSGTSLRNTEAKRYSLVVDVPSNSTKNYQFQIQNNAVSGGAPLVHLYQTTTSRASFSGASASYTVGKPAFADEATAVGAYVQRNMWTDYQGNGWTYGLTGGPFSDGTFIKAPFSSEGPRVDGVIKPDIAAPGMGTISTRDSVFSTVNELIIDNDGLNLNGSGPANYYLKQGTSMACPMAAGSFTLMLQARNLYAPSLSNRQVRAILYSSADESFKSIDNISGNGLIDILGGTVQTEVSSIPDWSML